MTGSSHPALDAIGPLLERAAALRAMAPTERAGEARLLVHEMRAALGQVGNEAVWEATQEPLPSDRTRRVGAEMVAERLGLATSTVSNAVMSYRTWLRGRVSAQVR